MRFHTVRYCRAKQQISKRSNNIDATDIDAQLVKFAILPDIFHAQTGSRNIRHQLRRQDSDLIWSSASKYRAKIKKEKKKSMKYFSKREES